MTKSRFTELLEKYKKAELLEEDPDNDENYIEDVNNLSSVKADVNTLLMNLLVDVITEGVEEAEYSAMPKAAKLKSSIEK